MFDSAVYLAEHMQDLPLAGDHPWTLAGRPAEGAGVAGSAGFFASIYPAVWSFCRALRARGLGSALTTLPPSCARKGAATPSSAFRTMSPR